MKDLLALAFLGDALHTLYVREKIVRSSSLKMDEINKLASKFCRATFQAKVLDKLIENLSEEEKELVRKTRNIKNKHKAKNTDIMTYKKATCFEALVGYHYLEKNLDRMTFLLEESMKGEN